MTAILIVNIICLAVSTFLLCQPTKRYGIKERIVAGLVCASSFALVMWSSGQLEAHHHPQVHTTVKEISV